MLKQGGKNTQQWIRHASVCAFSVFLLISLNACNGKVIPATDDFGSVSAVNSTNKPASNEDISGTPATGTNASDAQTSGANTSDAPAADNNTPEIGPVSTDLPAEEPESFSIEVIGDHNIVIRLKSEYLSKLTNHPNDGGISPSNQLEVQTISDGCYGGFFTVCKFDKFYWTFSFGNYWEDREHHHSFNSQSEMTGDVLEISIQEINVGKDIRRLMAGDGYEKVDEVRLIYDDYIENEKKIAQFGPDVICNPVEIKRIDFAKVFTLTDAPKKEDLVSITFPRKGRTKVTFNDVDIIDKYLKSGGSDWLELNFYDKTSYAVEDAYSLKMEFHFFTADEVSMSKDLYTLRMQKEKVLPDEYGNPQKEFDATFGEYGELAKTTVQPLSDGRIEGYVDFDGFEEIIKSYPYYSFSSVNGFYEKNIFEYGETSALFTEIGKYADFPAEYVSESNKRHIECLTESPYEAKIIRFRKTVALPKWKPNHYIAPDGYVHYTLELDGAEEETEVTVTSFEIRDITGKLTSFTKVEFPSKWELANVGALAWFGIFDVAEVWNECYYMGVRVILLDKAGDPYFYVDEVLDRCEELFPYTPFNEIGREDNVLYLGSAPYGYDSSAKDALVFENGKAVKQKLLIDRCETEIETYGIFN